MMIPIPYSNYEICGIKGGGYAVKFIDYWGEERALNIEDIVVLRKFFNRREVGGDGNDPILNTLEMIQASNEGLLSASVSNKVVALLSRKKRCLLTVMSKKKSQDQFAKRFADAAENGGVVGIDAMEEYTPLKRSRRGPPMPFR